MYKRQGLIKDCDVIDLIIEIMRGSKNIKDAKACLVHGKTDAIKFKSEESKQLAAQLQFTEKQATAILEMRLYKLIGLEIEALLKEHDKTLKNIATYENILGSRTAMAKVIIKELDAFKKEYAKEMCIRDRIKNTRVYRMQEIRTEYFLHLFSFKPEKSLLQ